MLKVCVKFQKNPRRNSWRKITFSLFWGVFDPKRPPRGTTGVLPGSAIMILCSYQLSLHFGKISEKCNGWMKSYEAKSVIFGHFGAFLTPFEPPGTQPVFFSKI